MNVFSRSRPLLGLGLHPSPSNSFCISINRALIISKPTQTLRCLHTGATPSPSQSIRRPPQKTYKNYSTESQQSKPLPPAPSETKLPIPAPATPETQVATSPSDEYNPPSTTRPPPLKLPVRKADDSTPGHLFRTARSYFTFYKTGLKAIWSNRQFAQPIQERLRQAERNDPDSKRKDPAGFHHGTRAEFQLIRRNMHDLRRVPIFVVLLCVFGEFLPLIMFGLKTRIVPALPYTVRLPSQAEAHRTKVFERQQMVQKRWEIFPTDQMPQEFWFRYSAEFHGLTPAWIPYRMLPGWSMEGFAQPYLKYLLQDDLLLGQKGVAALNEEELIMATVERGLWDPSADVKELRSRLAGQVKHSLAASTADF
ncbi:hypothetical protein BT63DRAFT_427131 [Microthyrium microscopicum]|uniref:Letm1 RBD domain-containing protein n=1 Tax=Microthyrium microscopicum TaxID=703497 RepID=A0A6A6U550_9PEZI|nr:hypothetical protein BT63DRAFT_427131 [Microthyrium microscopicum]